MRSLRKRTFGTSLLPIIEMVTFSHRNDHQVIALPNRFSRLRVLVFNGVQVTFHHRNLYLFF